MRVFSARDCLEHRVPVGFPERPERLSAIRDRLVADGRELVDVTVASEEWVDRVHRLHGEEYVQRFRNAVARGDGIFDSADNPLSPGTWGAARAAVVAGLTAVDTVMEGGAGTAFVAARPPGHHAEHDLAMGFCYFNTIAVAAQYALDVHDAQRIAIFDFDVHHGNGTQHLFEERADVLYASVHQYPFYPGTGAANETGIGPGAGATLNVPLGAGSGDDVYAAAHRDTVYPALAAFAPDVLFVSAGFDAWQRDPLGGMKVSEDGFRTWGAEVRELADRVCGGRIVSVLEGGYDLEALPSLVAAYLDGMEGV